MPRKNSGIRGMSLRTEGALGSAVFEGHIRYPHGPKALYNRGVRHRLAKKSLKYLHMCKICCTFVPDFILAYCARACTTYGDDGSYALVGDGQSRGACGQQG